MSANPWSAFRALISGPPLQVGQVLNIQAGTARVQMPGGGVVNARGEATVGQHVFLRGQVIEGEAPDLPVITIEI
jgi:hypothetical protein